MLCCFDEAKLTKQPGLQGPIDDAFMSKFCFVTPATQASPCAVDNWVSFELAHAVHRWEAVFRGTPHMRTSDELSIADAAALDCNIVLWGTPASNHLIAALFKGQQVPLCYTEKTVTVGEQNFSAATHVPLLVYPSPWSAARYVVVNSGVTHREEDDRTNALQNPKLPDWAVLDISAQPPTAETAGKVVAADFFDEHWLLKAPRL